MFKYKIDILNDGRVHKFSITHNTKPLCYVDALDLWQHDESFRSFFISLLTEIPFSAYRWESPPVTSSTVNRAFEFVLLDSPSLIRPPDTKTFESYFTTDEPGAGIVVFENLGKDAVLVVPSPRTSDSAYAHLAAFTRNGPDSQNHALWQIVGETMQKRISARPIWLSTAGGGVSWIHVRLDSWPKYYGFHPYTEFR